MKKIIKSILVIIASLTCVVSVTYAWFRDDANNGAQIIEINYVENGHRLIIEKTDMELHLVVNDDEGEGLVELYDENDFIMGGLCPGDPRLFYLKIKNNTQSSQFVNISFVCNNEIVELATGPVNLIDYVYFNVTASDGFEYINVNPLFGSVGELGTILHDGRYQVTIATRLECPPTFVDTFDVLSCYFMLDSECSFEFANRFFDVDLFRMDVL